MEYAYDFGQTLKSLRKEKHMTQTELGNRLGISKAAVSKYELGLASPPLDILRTMAAIFNISLDYLCGTEQREKISVYQLTYEQVILVKKFIQTLKEHNKNQNITSMEQKYLLLGEITTILFK